jgi:hypothetical protein
MPQIAEAVPAPKSFASLLASLAAQEKPEENTLPAWNDDGLADDVATLSYERALRAHARYRPAAPDSRPLATRASQPGEESSRFEPAAGQKAPGRTTATDGGGNDMRRQKREPPSEERNLKLASVTIRISQAECEQLRMRAAEAGLTVSAYLRSCVFEVEALRAQVKEALAQMRPPAYAEMPSEPARSWWTRVWPHAGRQPAPA